MYGKYILLGEKTGSLEGGLAWTALTSGCNSLTLPMDTYLFEELLPEAKRCPEALLLNFEYVKYADHPLAKTGEASEEVQKAWEGRPMRRECEANLVSEMFVKISFKSGLLYCICVY